MSATDQEWADYWDALLACLQEAFADPVTDVYVSEEAIEIVYRAIEEIG